VLALLRGPAVQARAGPVVHCHKCRKQKGGKSVALPSKHARWRWAGTFDSVCAGPRDPPGGITQELITCTAWHS